MEVSNHERPQETLDMKCPAEVYQPCTGVYQGLPDIDYPLHHTTIVVTRCGHIGLGEKKINFSQVFAGQDVGFSKKYKEFLAGVGQFCTSSRTITRTISDSENEACSPRIK